MSGCDENETMYSCLVYFSIVCCSLLDGNLTLLLPDCVLLSLSGAPVDFKQEVTPIDRLVFYPPCLVQPVHLAAASGQVGIVEILLNNGELAW